MRLRITGPEPRATDHEESRDTDANDRPVSRKEREIDPRSPHIDRPPIMATRDFGQDSERLHARDNTRSLCSTADTKVRKLRLIFLMDTYYTTFMLTPSHWCPHARARYLLVTRLTRSHLVMAGATRFASFCLLRHIRTLLPFVLCLMHFLSLSYLSDFSYLILIVGLLYIRRLDVPGIPALCGSVFVGSRSTRPRFQLKHLHSVSTYSTSLPHLPHYLVSCSLTAVLLCDS